MASDNGPRLGLTDRESGGESSRSSGSVQTSAELQQIKGFVEWWRGWWWRRTGYAGVLVPAALALIWWFLLGWQTIPLGAGLGIGASLLWSKGTRNAKIGSVVLAGVPLLPVVAVAAAWAAGPVVLIVILWLMYKNGKLGKTGPYHARWAETSETEDMRMPQGGEKAGNERAGIALGEKDGELMWVYPGFEGRKEMGHILVTGPSRSGKSLHLETNLLLWPGSAIVNDIKGSIHGNAAYNRRIL